MALVTVDRSETRIARIQLSRPPANAYDLVFLDEMHAIIETIRRDAECRVVMICGNEKFFSAGADIKWMSSGRTSSELATFAQVGHELLAKIERLPQIVIAVIEGHAMGGGLELALACDLRFMAAGNGQLAVPEVKISAVPNMGGTQRLPRLIGRSRALDMLITGRTVGHEEALRIGLVDRVFAPKELVDQTKEYGKQLAGGAGLAITLIKRAVNEGVYLSLEAGLALEREAGNVVFRSQDFKEGIKAFGEKRPPKFTGS